MTDFEMISNPPGTAKIVRLELPIQTGIIQVEDVSVTKDASVYQALLECARKYRRKYADKTISDIPGVQRGRQLFRMMGIEPTKHRPSSEAMLRRAMKDKPIYAVNTLVDVSNWCALDFLLPNGIYDVRKIKGDILLCKGLPGDEYVGVNKREVHLENRYALRDEIGPFGSPMTDSHRTAIDSDTRAAIAIMYAPPEYNSDHLLTQCQDYAERILRHCGGHIVLVSVSDSSRKRGSD